MTGAAWPSWLALGVSAAAYGVAALTATAFANAPSWAKRRVNGPFAAAIARGLSLVAALAAALSLAAGLRAAGFVFVQASVVSGASVAAAAGVLHAAVGLLGAANRPQTRALLYPVAAAFEAFGSLPVLRTLAGRYRDPASPDTGEAVSAALESQLELLEAAGVGAEHSEVRMVRAVLDLDKARVREIMRPRVDMIAARVDAEPDDLANLMVESGHSKIPLYRDNIDDIVGIAYAQDVLRGRVNGVAKQKSVRELARPALFVPESQRLEQLLQEFQKARTQMAIVIDEYGGVSGLVTVQDLIEEIVGELVDEFDKDEPEVRRLNDNEIIMDARVTIDDLNDEFDANVEAEGFDTVGGLVYRELGRMPARGDRVQVGRLRIVVESTVGRRIRRLRVSRSVPSRPGGGASRPPSTA